MARETAEVLVKLPELRAVAVTNNRGHMVIMQAVISGRPANVDQRGMQALWHQN